MRYIHKSFVLKWFRVRVIFHQDVEGSKLFVLTQIKNIYYNIWCDPMSEVVITIPYMAEDSVAGDAF